MRRVVVIGDGATWIWEHVATTFGNERVEILDWYHCCQHLWTIGAAVRGVGAPEMASWIDQAKDLIWERGPAALVSLLATLQAPTEERQKVLNTERGYFRCNAERMHTNATVSRAGRSVRVLWSRPQNVSCSND